MKKLILIFLIFISCASQKIEKDTFKDCTPDGNPEFLSCIQNRIMYDIAMKRNPSEEKLKYIFDECCRQIKLINK